MKNPTTKSKKSTQSKNSSRKQYNAPALEKGLDIIELLAEQTGSLNLSEIANKLGRSVGEIFRMLVVLEQRNYISLNEKSDRYNLTLKLFEIVHKQYPIGLLTTTAAPYMKTLALNIGQSCHLTIRNEGCMLVIAQQDSYGDRRFGLKVGASAPVFESCSGNLFYAFSAPEDQEIILRDATNASKQKIDTTKLTSLVKKIRKNGLYKVNSRQIAGVVDIGFPVFAHEGTIAATLVVPYLKHMSNQQLSTLEDAETEAKKMAELISEALGHLVPK